MKRFSIENLKVTDLEAVLQIEQSSHSHPWSLGNFKDALSAGYHMRILYSGDEVCAYYISMQVLEDVHLLNITVKSAFRGLGYASALLQDLVFWAYASSATNIWLEVRASNVAAISLYSKAGFFQCGLRKSYYALNNRTREDALLLKKDL